MVEALSLGACNAKAGLLFYYIYIGYSATESQMEELSKQEIIGVGEDISPVAVLRSSLTLPTLRDELMAEVLSFFDERVIPSERHRVALPWKHSRRNRAQGIQTSLFQGQHCLERERQRQDTINAIKKKFGKNFA